jgi:hypothetical protein
MSNRHIPVAAQVLVAGASLILIVVSLIAAPVGRVANGDPRDHRQQGARAHHLRRFRVSVGEQLLTTPGEPRLADLVEQGAARDGRGEDEDEDAREQREDDDEGDGDG